MNTLENMFWSTRLDAKVAYKKWKLEESAGTSSAVVDKCIKKYRDAWAEHLKASRELFLAECERD